MQLLYALIDQLKGLWNRWSIAQRAGISAAALGCIGVVAGTLMWATRVDYVVLQDQMTPQKGAEVAGLLQNEQIPFELNFSGSTISVPRSEVSRARLALKDIINPSSEEPDFGMGLFPGSPAESDQRRQRQLEQRLARSIMLVKGVRSAVVHVSQPMMSPFTVEKVPPSASIIIELAPNGQFTSTAAQSIVQLVADAVEGLSPEHVTLADTFGRQLASRQAHASGMNEQLEFKQREEASRARKAESLLTAILGPGKAVVQVVADIDFSERTTETRTYDNEGNAKRNESTEITESTGGMRPPTPATGATQNLDPESVGSGSSNGKYKHEIINTDYEVGTVDEKIRDFPGKLKRLTVAAVVDLPAAGAADGSAPAGSMPTLQQIRSTIEQAVGYDVSRNDEISVTVAPLQQPDEAIPPMTPLMYWKEYQSLIQTIILATAAFLAFIVGILLLKKMRPVVVHAASDEPVSVADVRRLQSISEQAKAHPEVVASILAAWLRESAAEPSQAPPEVASPPRTGRRAA